MAGGRNNLRSGPEREKWHVHEPWKLAIMQETAIALIWYGTASTLAHQFRV
jgi:hypothetical protein